MSQRIFVDGIKVYDGDAILSEKQIAFKKAKEEIGREAWKELHLRALKSNGQDDTEWLMGYFSSRIPRSGCGCLRDWIDLLKINSPRWDDYFAWSVEVHNAINSKLMSEGDKAKRLVTLDEARRVWLTRKI